MRIAAEYAGRLARISRNINQEGIKTLVYEYPDHGFVIDFPEAKRLFRKVRQADQDILLLLESIDRSDIRSPDGYYVAQLAAPVETATRGPAEPKKGA